MDKSDNKYKKLKTSQIHHLETALCDLQSYSQDVKPQSDVEHHRSK